MLIVDHDKTDSWIPLLSQHNPELLADYPYVGYTDIVKDKIE